MAGASKKPKKKPAPKKAAKAPAKKAAKATAKPKGNAKPKPRHGTRSRYVKHKCRCNACRAANANYTKRLKAERAMAEKKVPRGPKLSAALQSQRDALIVTRRAQSIPWGAVASEVGLSISATEAAYRKRLEAMDSLLEVNAQIILEALINGLQMSIGDLEQLALAAIEERNVPAAVGAKRAANEAREKLQGLLQSTGILPHDLGVMRHQFEAHVFIRKIVVFVEAFIGEINDLELPKDKRPAVIEATARLSKGLDDIGASTNGDSDGPEEAPEPAAATAGG